MHKNIDSDSPGKDTDFIRLKNESIIFSDKCTHLPVVSWIAGFKRFLCVFRHHCWDPAEMNVPSGTNLTEERVEVVLKSLLERLNSSDSSNKRVLVPLLCHFTTALPDTLLQRYLSQIMPYIDGCLLCEGAPPHPELCNAVDCLLKWIKTSPFITHFNSSILMSLDDYVKNSDNAFRLEPIFPTKEEISTGTIQDVANFRSSFQGHIQYQFRLMRKDFLTPIVEYLHAIHNDNTSYYENSLSLRPYDLRYDGCAPTRCAGIIELFAVKMDKKTLQKTDWEKKLMDGNMMIISSSEKFPYDKLAFGCITNQMNNDTKDKAKDREKKIGFFVCEEFRDTFDAMIEDGTTSFFALESDALFVPYHRSLLALREVHTENVDKDIANAMVTGKTVVPKFFCGATIDLGIFACRGVDNFLNLSNDERVAQEQVDDAFCTRLKNTSEELEEVTTTNHSQPQRVHVLDGTQQEAMKQMLKHNIAIIQGPPGTGKTFVGHKYLQMLLNAHTATGSSLFPVMLVGYTNHSVDSVLKAVEHMFPKDKIIRLGIPKDESLAEYTLHKHIEKLNRNNSTKIKPPKVVGNLFEKVEKATKIVKVIQEIKTIITELATPRLKRELQYPKPRMNINYINFSGRMYKTTKELEEDEKAFRKLVYDSLDEWWNEVQGNVFRREKLHRLQQKLNHPNYKSNFNSLSLFDLRRAFDGEYQDRSRLEQHNPIQDNDLRAPDEKRQEYEGDDALILPIVRKITDRTRLREARNILASPQDHSAHHIRTAVLACLDDVMFVQLRPLYNELSRNEKGIREYYINRDACVFHRMHLIVATTTGAARYLEALRRSNVRIVLVEEAAQILEGHLLSLLTDKTQQMVLIGDPMQLRPRVVTHFDGYNPLAYSLQERLIELQAPYASICTQRRMHPDLAAIVKTYYEKPPYRYYKPIFIEDASTTLNREGVPWVDGDSRIVFINHSHKEERVKNTTTCKNEWEAQAALRIAVFSMAMLLRSGNTCQKPHERITILTFYAGQAQLLTKLLHERKEESEQYVRIATVDDYQGEENDIIILSLTRTTGTSSFCSERNRICVALSRARCALFVLGNIDHVTGSCTDTMWKKLLEKAKVVNVTEHTTFPAQCPVHKKPQRFCPSLNLKAKEYKGKYLDHCDEICGARYDSCPDGHTCSQKCHGKENHAECKTLVPFECPKCKKIRDVPCYLAQKSPLPKTPEYEEYCCREPCSLDTNCGHRCIKHCGEACECAGDELYAVELVKWCKHQSPKVTVNCAVGQWMKKLLLEEETNPKKRKSEAMTSIKELYQTSKKAVIKSNFKMKRIIQESEEAGNIIINECTELCRSQLECGHLCSRKCHKDSLCYCGCSCNMTRACGHSCGLPCSYDFRTTTPQQRIRHLYCTERCPYGDKYLPCGHQCTRRCRHDGKSEEGVCLCTLPCKHKCQHNNSDHTKREHFCGDCLYICKQQCQRKPCVHKENDSSGACTAMCSEPCNNALAEPCRERCGTLLTCGHRCYGACGEKCPELCPKCFSVDELVATDIQIEQKVKQEELLSERWIDNKIVQKTSEIVQLLERMDNEEQIDGDMCVKVSSKGQDVFLPLLFQYPCSHICFLSSVDALIQSASTLCCPKCHCEVQYCDTSRYNTLLKKSRATIVSSNHNTQQMGYTSRFNDSMNEFNIYLTKIRNLNARRDIRGSKRIYSLLASISLKDGLQFPGRDEPPLHLSLPDIEILADIAINTFKILEVIHNPTSTLSHCDTEVCQYLLTYLEQAVEGISMTLSDVFCRKDKNSVNTCLSLLSSATKITSPELSYEQWLRNMTEILEQAKREAISQL